MALVSAFALAGQNWPHAGGWGWPWGVLWLIFAVLFWGGLIVLLIWAVRSVSAPRRAPDTAMQVLKRRLASGEITREEYEHIRRLLQD